MIYDREDVYSSTIEYFDGDDLATNVWINKYALKDSYGTLFELSPNDMHQRLASEFARIESNYPNPLSQGKIFELIKDFKYIIPQGGSMSGIGNNLNVSSLSNCFVVGKPGRDSYGTICTVDQELVQLSKRRGGTGTDLSDYRPAGTSVNNSARTSTGVVPFAERYSNSIREVAQEGRRGALMLTLDIRHPDSEVFIDAKMTEGKITGANVSVKISDDFMQAVINKKPFTLTYPINSKEPKFIKEIDASTLWDKIIHNAWKSAEPGVLFWDQIIRESPADCYIEEGFKTISTNPCGELPLCPDDSCRLLVINLYSYVDNPFTENATFNEKLFIEHVHYALKLMDDIVDLELEKIDQIISKIKSDPEEEEIKAIELRVWERIRKMANNGRRCGLGITAEGDMLAALGYTYGTPEATKFAVSVAKTLAVEAYRESAILAKERGAFPIWNNEKELNNPFLNRIKDVDPELKKDLETTGRRNIALLTIAPTGSVSICSKTTSGIEPVFLPVYKRRRKINPNDKGTVTHFIDDSGDHWEEYAVTHDKFKVWIKISGLDANLDSMTQAEINELVKQSPYHNATSADVNWVEKVKMQGEIQKWVDHSISVTVNVPQETTEEIVRKVYETAWESGCKGCTIYRDGSRTGVLISNDDIKTLEETLKENNAERRPKYLKCKISRFVNNKEKWIGFLGIKTHNETNEEYPYELFTGLEDSFYIPKYVEEGVIRKTKTTDQHNIYDFIYKDKNGYDVIMTGLDRAFNKEYWNTGKFISAMLRHRIYLPTIINLIDTIHLNGVEDKNFFGTWQSGVKRILKGLLKEEHSGICPQCGSERYIPKDGCKICLDCGYSACN